MPRDAETDPGSRRRRRAMRRARILGTLAGVLLWLWRWTIRLEVRGLEHARAHPRASVAIWHGRVHGSLYAFAGWPLSAMFSASPDGELAARALAVFGIGAVRGSTGKGGGRALQAMIEQVRNGTVRYPVLTVDGPKGPFRRCKPGVVRLGRELGLPVVPVSFSATRAWVFRSWDRMVLVKPFSKVVVEVGSPIAIPPDEAMERSLDRIGRALDELTERLDLEVHGSLLWDVPAARAPEGSSSGPEPSPEDRGGHTE